MSNYLNLRSNKRYKRTLKEVKSPNADEDASLITTDQSSSINTVSAHSSKDPVESIGDKNRIHDLLKADDFSNVLEDDHKENKIPSAAMEETTDSNEKIEFGGIRKRAHILIEDDTYSDSFEAQQKKNRIPTLVSQETTDSKGTIEPKAASSAENFSTPVQPAYILQDSQSPLFLESPVQSPSRFEEAENIRIEKILEKEMADRGEHIEKIKYDEYYRDKDVEGILDENPSSYHSDHDLENYAARLHSPPPPSVPLFKQDTDIYYNDTELEHEYTEEFLASILSNEELYSPNYNDIVSKRSFSSHLRTKVVNQIITISHTMELNPKVIFDAVILLDIYLGIRGAKENYIFMIGLGFLFVAAKFDSQYHRSAQKFIEVSKIDITREQLFKLEMHILERIDYRISPPSPFDYFNLLSLPDGGSLTCKIYARFILELTLLSSELLIYPLTLKAATAFYLARRVTGKGGWSPELVKYSSYTREQLQECLTPVIRVIVNKELGLSTRRFYSAREYESASTHVTRWVHGKAIVMGIIPDEPLV